MLNSQSLVTLYIDHLMAISQSLFTISFFELNLVFDLWTKKLKVLHRCDVPYLSLAFTGPNGRGQKRFLGDT